MNDLSIPTETQRNRFDWNMGRSWIAANALAHIFTLCVLMLTSVILDSTLGGSSSENYQAAAAPTRFIGIGLVDGIVVGFAQSMVFKRYLQRPWPREWILATALGVAIAWFAAQIIGYLLSFLLFFLFAILFAATGRPLDYLPFLLGLLFIAVTGYLAGAFVGSFQVRVIKKYLNQQTGWVRRSGLAGLA